MPPYGPRVPCSRLLILKMPPPPLQMPPPPLQMPPPPLQMPPPPLRPACVRQSPSGRDRLGSVVASVSTS